MPDMLDTPDNAMQKLSEMKQRLNRAYESAEQTAEADCDEEW